MVISFFLWLINDLIKTQKENTILQEEKRNAEVSFLRSQINPHFIFNTMNNIYSLVYHQSEKALPAIEKLSGIMRYVMKDNDGEKIELTKEIDYLKDFIELQSLRSVGEANVKFDIEGNTEGKMIAPLLLVPFVENGFKHGVVNDDENPFLINLIIEKNKLFFQCSNKIAVGRKDESSGIGLQNVKRRLELLYADQYHLNIDHSEKYYTITLNIEL
jgi:LytS/YehU family sensor histidine kinase